LSAQQAQGGWGIHGRMRYFPGISQEEKAIVIAGLTLVGGPLAILRGAGMGVSAARLLLLTMLFPPSPGGGGPGQFPISTTPPLSLEATGASLTQPGKPRGPASSSKRRSRPRRCKARFHGDHGEYPVPVRCQKNAGHRWKHRAGKFTW